MCASDIDSNQSAVSHAVNDWLEMFHQNPRCTETHPEYLSSWQSVHSGQRTLEEDQGRRFGKVRDGLDRFTRKMDDFISLSPSKLKFYINTDRKLTF